MPRFGEPLTHVHGGVGSGGQLDWDSIFSDAVHGHFSNVEGGFLPMWPHQISSGRYYCAPPIDRLTGQIAPGANVLWLTPALFPEAVTIDRLCENVLVNAAGAKLRLGYYTDVNGVPTALVVDSGELDASTTGEKAAVVAATLGPGVLWRAVFCNHATVELPCYNAGTPVGGASRSGAVDNLSLSAALTFAALPATAPTMTGEQNRGFAVVFRIA